MLLSFLSVTFPHCPAPKINWDFCLPRTLCSRFSPDNTVHIVLQVLHRQRSDDCSSRLGNASIWSGDRAGRLVDHAKVGPLLSLHFAFLICVHLFALWSWWWKVLHNKLDQWSFHPPTSSENRIFLRYNSARHYSSCPSSINNFSCCRYRTDEVEVTWRDW